MLAALSFAYLMWKARSNNFFFDEWSWIQDRRSGLHSIVAAYNQHVLVIPVAIYQLLFHTVGLAHYWTFRALGVLAHLGCTAALFVFVRRRLGALALLVVLPVLVLGSGWEYVLLPVNLGFTASLGLSITALLMLERRDQRGDVSACFLLVVALACSEFAIVFVIGIALELWLRSRTLHQAWIWLVPLVIYGAWWLGYHEASPWRHNLTAVPTFASELAAAAAGALLGMNSDWGRVFLVVIVCLVGLRLAPRGSITPRAAMLILAAVLFWGIVALGRAQNGDSAASRYIYTGVVLLILLGAEAFRGFRLRPKAVWFAAFLALFATVANVRALTIAENGQRVASEVVSAELGAIQLARASAPPSLRIDTHYAPVVNASTYFTAIDALHSSPALPPQRLIQASEVARAAADDVLVRAGALAVRISRINRGVSTEPPTVESSPAGTSSERSGCVRFAPNGPRASIDLLPSTTATKFTVTGHGPPAQILARRFATTFATTTIASVSGGSSLVVTTARDSSSVPWHLRALSKLPIVACQA